MTRRRILFIDTNGKQYLTEEYNGDKSELASFHSADSCDKDWEDIEMEFRLCKTLDEFQTTDKRAQSYYHSNLGPNEYIPASELEIINHSYAGNIITIMAEHPTHIVFGDYVFTPEKNAFNNKTSWWISKKGYTMSLYCFSAYTENEAVYHLKAKDSYIKMFEDNLTKFVENPFSKTDIDFIRFLIQQHRNELPLFGTGIWSETKTEEAAMCERLLERIKIDY